MVWVSHQKTWFGVHETQKIHRVEILRLLFGITRSLKQLLFVCVFHKNAFITSYWNNFPRSQWLLMMTHNIAAVYWITTFQQYFLAAYVSSRRIDVHIRILFCTIQQRYASEIRNIKKIDKLHFFSERVLKNQYQLYMYFGSKFYCVFNERYWV